MKYIITALFCSLFITQVWSQTPQKMSYQAVVRDSNGDLVTNQVIGIKISILKGTIDGSTVYLETQNPETNSNGLMSLEIGGSTAEILSGNISEINWSNDNYFVKTETDPNGGTEYTISGTSQLLSVPYALHANTADNLTGEVSYDESDPVFNSSVASGIQEQDTANWNNKLESFTEADPLYNSSIAAGIQEQDTANWNNKVDEEVDGSITNEIQSFSVSRTGDTLYIDKGNFVIIPGISQANLPEEEDPVFIDVNFNLEKVAEGTNVTFTFIIDDPYYTNVNFLDYVVVDPFENPIYGFNENVTFTETDPGVFEYSDTFLIGNDQNNGEYKAVNIYVTNELNSYVYYEEFVYFNINN